MELIIIILGIVIDRVTKIWASNNLVNNDIKILDGIFDLQYVENRGAAFGIFQNKIPILVFITALIVIFIIFYYIKYKPKSTFLKIGISLVISGAFGNMYDRIFNGFVVDFLFFHYKNFIFPNFNVADILVVCGTILISIYIIKDVK